ncbi:MAG: hypothetical protein IKP40_12765 [Clostridia bacterium]|nr:hypothetical protein [Clostridia bacterium]
MHCLIRMSKGRFHELSHDWLWKTAEITTTSRGSKVESALLSPLPLPEFEADSLLFLPVCPELIVLLWLFLHCLSGDGFLAFPAGLSGACYLALIALVLLEKSLALYFS